MTTETTPGPKKAKTDSKKQNQPTHTIRDGAIAASIWLRQTQTGLPYYEYSLSRSYKSMTSGKAGYTANFFSRNETALLNVVRQASKWIAEAEQKDLANNEALAA